MKLPQNKYYFKGLISMYKQNTQQQYIIYYYWVCINKYSNYKITDYRVGNTIFWPDGLLGLIAFGKSSTVVFRSVSAATTATNFWPGS